MRKIICYVSGVFAILNFIVIFPALMDNAPAYWIKGRIFCAIVFGGLCYFLAKKKHSNKENTNVANTKIQESKIISVNIESQKVDEQDAEESEFISSSTEQMAKDLLVIASNAISEIINISGKLTRKGLAEAILFNSYRILNDPLLQKQSYYDALSDDYLLLLYFFIKDHKPDLDSAGVLLFIQNRLNFYAGEFHKMTTDKNYSSLWIYSAFYHTPMEDKIAPKPDVAATILFQVGLIKMTHRITEVLHNKIQQS